MFTLFTLLITLIFAQGCPRRHHHHHHHKSETSESSSSPSSSSSINQFSSGDDKEWPVEVVQMHPASAYTDMSGFYPFDFGRAGTWARQSFSLYLTDNRFIQVWDCYCGGDRFSLYVNGEFMGSTNSQCLFSTGDCNFFSTDPLECLVNPGWCKFDNMYTKSTGALNDDSVVMLMPGFYNITIMTAFSFYDRGVGYIMAFPLNP